MPSSRTYDSVVRTVLFACAALSLAAVASIAVFVFMQGLPLFAKYPLTEFLFSSRWEPTAEDPSFGVLAFILGSLLVTALALLIAVPVGIASGIYLAFLAPRAQARIIKASVDLLAGIPSIVYGLFGVAAISLLVRSLFGGTGYGALSAAITLALMTLPTIVSVTYSSLVAVGSELTEGSLALGATRWQTIARVIVPAARSGIIAGAVLGMGRAIGETMAVLMVAGNAPVMPDGLLGMVRTLTMNIVTDMSYATGDHMTALFSTGCVLFVFILALNLAVQLVLRRPINGGAGRPGIAAKAHAPSGPEKR